MNAIGGARGAFRSNISPDIYNFELLGNPFYTSSNIPSATTVIFLISIVSNDVQFLKHPWGE